MVIPRENKLVRLYIQMVQTEKGEGKLDRSKITPELILASAQKVRTEPLLSVYVSASD